MKNPAISSQKEPNLADHNFVIIFLLFYFETESFDDWFFYSEFQNSIIAGFCSNQHFPCAIVLNIILNLKNVIWSNIK